MPIGLTRPDAAARISGSEQAPALKGEVRFYQKRGGVIIAAQLSGLPQDIPFCTLCIPGESRLSPILNCGGTAYLVMLTGLKMQDIIGKKVALTCAEGQHIGCGTVGQPFS